jgi:homoserine O-acetyltransferase
MSTHTVRDFRLAGGGVLPHMTVAYATLGTLNAAGDNAVLVLHGYTTGPDMLQPGAGAAEGSWSELVGPGRAIDTDRWFVVCPNMLGSACGSTGPGSTDPRSGQPYGADFPAIVLADIVAAQKLLLDHLGVRHLAAVAGPSFGGYQALQWAVDHPAMVERVVMAVSAPFNPPSAVLSGPMLQALQQEPAWNHGHPAPGAMTPWLTALRVQTLVRYGIDEELRERFPDAGGRAAEVRRLARAWALGFNAGSLITLARAAEAFDLRPRLQEVKAPLLLVVSRSDEVFSPALLDEAAPLFDAAGLRWQGRVLDSDKGHVASGADAQLWSEDLRRFMNTPPEEAFR